jgi:hypothetical protein
MTLGWLGVVVMNLYPGRRPCVTRTLMRPSEEEGTVLDEDDAGKRTYEQVSAIADKLDDAGREEFAALLADITQKPLTASWPVRRWLQDAGWLTR